MKADQFSAESRVRRTAAKAVILVAIAVGMRSNGLLIAQDLTDSDRAALSEFEKRAADYIKTIHKSPMGKPMKPAVEVSDLEKERTQAQAAAQQVRANAKQGGMFTQEAAVAFKKLLKQALSGPEGAKITASLKHAEPLVPTSLVVNAPFPTQQGQPMQSVPPTLLENLPKLPKGLEYRVAGKSLALRGVDANIVVDYIPNALP